MSLSLFLHLSGKVVLRLWAVLRNTTVDVLVFCIVLTWADLRNTTLTIKILCNVKKWADLRKTTVWKKCNQIDHISIPIKLTKELQKYQVFITCCVLAMTIPGLVIDWHLMMSSASVNQSQWESTVTRVNHKGDTLLCCQTIDSRDFEVSNFVKKMMSYCACVSVFIRNYNWC